MAALSGGGTSTFQGATLIRSTGPPHSGLRLDGGRIFRNEGTLTQNTNVDLNSRSLGVADAGNGSVLNARGATWNISHSGSGQSLISATSQGGGDTGAGAIFTNDGTFNKLGGNATDVRTAFDNSGLVDVQAGTLTFANGGALQGTTGTLQIGAAGIVQLNGSASTGNLFHNGSAADSLQLSTGTMTVYVDYDNANFGVGNAFNRLANVTASGAATLRLIASGDANQGLSGVDISNGTSTTPGLVIGNVHVGTNAFVYNIDNTGSSGPALRGAIQTNVNGANISDARLSGSGVTESNWGPLATGASLARDVVVTVNAAGVYTPISGQAVSIINNFENTNSHLLGISSAAGAAAYNLAAAGLVTPNPVPLATLARNPVTLTNLPLNLVLLPNQRVGGAAFAALSVANTAPSGSFTEGLNVSFGSITGSVLTNGGAINLLASGATDNSALSVGLDTSTAGARSGTVVMNLASDGAGTSGLGITALAPETVTVNGDVYRLANPTLNTASITLVARVGDAAPSASISVTNTSPDIFSERLDASFGALAAGFAGSGSITGLTAGASSSAQGVALNTASAGTFVGTADIGFVSSGVGTTGAADFALPSQAVALTGRVYAPAIAQVNTPTVDFGIVHRGDVVAARNVSVSNTAALAGLNDTLSGSIGGASGPFTAGGTRAGLAAQGTDATSFNIGLNTSAAGVFNGTAMAAFLSQNSELADLILGSSAIQLAGQVNNFAETMLTNSGAGQISFSNNTYTLDFGSIALGSGDLSANLAVLNSAIGPAADLLSGDFDLTGAGPGFTLSGFGPFIDLVAGDSFGGLSVVFASNVEGAFIASIVLHTSGSNASGFIGALGDTTLVLRGTVFAVPEPGTSVLVFVGLLGVIGAARARRLRHS